MRSTFSVQAAILLGGTFLSSAAFAQCPPVGQASACNAVITVTATGTTVQVSDQGPYDGSDDTLVGVVNNIPACTGAGGQTACGISISSLDLTSGNNIFGFDGDGITTFGVSGNSRDGTGYGGPNAYFTNISTDGTSGRVNFISPIPPGQTGFFSLENAVSTANSCSDLLMNSLQGATGGGYTPPPVGNTPNSLNTTEVRATFVPQGNDPTTGQPWTLQGAAQVCGFVNWDWQQTITNWPSPSNLFAANACTQKDARGNPIPITTPPSFNDPPSCGYSYQMPPGSGAVGIKVYYNVFSNGTPWSLDTYQNTTASPNYMSFFDAPNDPLLPAGQNIMFTNHLVGLQGQGPGFGVIDTGIGFTWISNHKGTTGGTTVTIGDPGGQVDHSGTGGTTISSVSQTPTYTGVGVTAINGASGGLSSLLSAMLPASRSVQIGKTATAFATMINTAPSTATACSIAPLGGLPLTFSYQTTNPQTNAVTGTANTPVDIAGNNGSQSFVIALTPTAAISPTDVQFSFSCTNANPAPIVTGLTTLLFSGSSTAPPDVVALAGTATNDGIMHITGTSGTAAFATATVNVGASSSITASTNTGNATLPLALTICQTNPSTGQCLATPAASVTTTISSNATPTFSVFGTASGAIPFDPANNRIFVTFTDSGNAVRGETSVAVQTQ